MNSKSFFDGLLQHLLISGQIFGPIFIHSTHGVAILNASEETMASVLELHQRATSPLVPAAAQIDKVPGPDVPVASAQQ